MPLSIGHSLLVCRTNWFSDELDLVKKDVIDDVMDFL